LPDWAGDGSAAVSAGRFRDLGDLPQVLKGEDVAGLSVAFTIPAGIRADAFGVASAGGPSLTPDSMFQAGSVSKAVTACAAHRLAAEGRLDLDAYVNNVLTSWTLPRVRRWQPARWSRLPPTGMVAVSRSRVAGAISLISAWWACGRRRRI
jgi:CubicO group peptidase (beta-lactamase class C family)